MSQNPFELALILSSEGKLTSAVRTAFDIRSKGISPFCLNIPSMEVDPICRYVTNRVASKLEILQGALHAAISSQKSLIIFEEEVTLSADFTQVAVSIMSANVGHIHSLGSYLPHASTRRSHPIAFESKFISVAGAIISLKAVPLALLIAQNMLKDDPIAHLDTFWEMCFRRDLLKPPAREVVSRRPLFELALEEDESDAIHRMKEMKTVDIQFIINPFEVNPR